MSSNQPPRWRRGLATLTAAAVALLGGVAGVAAPAQADDAGSTKDVKVNLSGFDHDKFPQPANDSGNPAAGLYLAAFTKDADLSKVTMENMDETVEGEPVWVTESQVRKDDGNLTKRLNDVPDSDELQVVTWVAHGNITPDTILSTSLLPAADSEIDVKMGDKIAEEPEEPEEPAEPEFKPETTGQITAASNKDGLSVKVDGSGYVNLPKASTGKDAMGAYVAMIDRDTKISDKEIEADAMVATEWVSPFTDDIKDGKFSKTVTAKADDLDKNKNYDVITFVAHGNLTKDTLIYRAPLELNDDQKEALFPTEKPEFKGSVKLTPSKDDDGFSIKVEAKDFDPAAFPPPANDSGKPADGVYVAAFKPGTDLSKVTMENMDETTLGEPLWVTGKSIKNNAFSKTVRDIPAEYAGKNVQVVTWVAHGNINKDVILTNDEVKMPGKATPPPAPGKVKAGTVKINGTAKVGKTLTAKTANWTKDAKFSYQWLRDGKSIKKATKATYKVAKADESKKLSVKVTGKKSGLKSASKTSAAVKVAKQTTKPNKPKPKPEQKKCAPSVFKKDGRTVTATWAKDGKDRKIEVKAKGFDQKKFPQPDNDSGKPADGVYIAAVKKNTKLSTITMENMDETTLGEALWVTGNSIKNGSFDKTVYGVSTSAGNEVRVITWVAHGNINKDVILSNQIVKFNCADQADKDKGNGNGGKGSNGSANASGNGGNGGNSSNGSSDASGNGGKDGSDKGNVTQQCEPVVTKKDGRTLTTTAYKDGKDYKVTLSGSGFINDKLPQPANDSGKGPAGVYAAVVKKDTDLSKITMENMDSTTLGEPIWITDNSLGAKGEFQNSVRGIEANAGNEVRVITWVAHGNITKDVILTDQEVPLDCAGEDQDGAKGANGSADSDAAAAGDASGAADGSVGGDDQGSVSGDLPGEMAAAQQCTVVYVPTSGASAEASDGTDSTEMSAPQAAAPAAGEADNADQGQDNTSSAPAASGPATLDWSVKPSFLSYIKGGIAKGKIQTSGGAQETGNSLTWGKGSGSLANGGTVSFPGSVHFTGHGGILDTKFSNIRIKLDGPGKATLTLDSKSQDMESKDISQSNVKFANITFSGDGSDGIKNGAVSLTADGAKAFAGFYSAGEKVGPVNLTTSSATSGPAGGTTTAVTLFGAVDQVSDLVSNAITSDAPGTDSGSAEQADNQSTEQPAGDANNQSASNAPVNSGITVSADANPADYQADAPAGMEATIVCGDDVASTGFDNTNLIGAGGLLALLGAAGVAFAYRRKAAAKN